MITAQKIFSSLLILILSSNVLACNCHEANKPESAKSHCVDDADQENKQQRDCIDKCDELSAITTVDMGVSASHYTVIDIAFSPAQAYTNAYASNQPAIGSPHPNDNYHNNTPIQRHDVLLN